MNDLFVEVAQAQIQKQGEELCGDRVDWVKGGNSTIIAWSDGLGSGVKASILSTLTSKIIVSMLEREASLDEVVETLAQTLPICRIRKIAYSTFSVIQVLPGGDTYLAEFDNPPIFWIRKGRLMQPERRERQIGKRKILESNFRIQKDDWLIGVTDGVVHAGIGGVWNLGWRWEKIASFLETTVNSHLDAATLAKKVIETTDKLYRGAPGDDATCVVAKVRLVERLILWAGPPEDNRLDPEIVQRIRQFPGKKVICGGTTANIAARLMGKKVEVDLSSFERDIPPVGRLEGVDLVTEGILTLSSALRRLRTGVKLEDVFYQKDGVSQLLKCLLEADEINIVGGRAINPAHQNPKLSGELSLKARVLEEIVVELSNRGKIVSLEFF
ncbi:MAG: hypothetical protein PWP04_264 [Candidatus Atribacteria bacterium]|nr:hypothetical protein [Candidatus Atribacteria bacterium]